jgi:hypothetical protein
MTPSQTEENINLQKDIDEWLAKGNKVEKVPYGKRGEGVESGSSFYGRKKKTTTQDTES